MYHSRPMPDTTILVAILATAGALVAGLSALPYPRVAFGVLFVIASFSRATLETPLGTMRPEMPAIATIGIALLLGGRLRGLGQIPRSMVAVAAAFAVYLVALTLSSAFVAPGTAQSMRMVAWLAISMIGGAEAFLLMRPRPIGSIEPLALAGAVMGVLGIVVATMFLITGPDFQLGIQEPYAEIPRVSAMGWETNLYASFLSMCSFFAVEVARGRDRRGGLLLLAAILVGFALGMTRGAYAGLAVGALAYAGVRYVVERRLSDLPRLGIAAAGFLVLGIALATVLLPNQIERIAWFGPSTAHTAPSVAPATASGSGTAGTNGPGATAPNATATPAEASAVPLPSLAPPSDTLGFRLERLPIALSEIPSSPLIGFGAESFGQRHPDRYAGAGPDHIAVMAVVVPYEAGLIGAIAVVVGFALLLLNLWRTARRSMAGDALRAVGASAAFVGSLVSLLVAYQVTNSLHMAVNWIVIGAAAALVAWSEQSDPAAVSAESRS
jgi:hypothetical protein